ncbi:putative ribonuclease H-like domain-containing protein, partial [Tanacetum coccineum]
VAFYAQKFAKPIRELCNQIGRRIQIKGPYIGIHHNLEKDLQELIVKCIELADLNFNRYGDTFFEVVFMQVMIVQISFQEDRMLELIQMHASTQTFERFKKTLVMSFQDEDASYGNPHLELQEKGVNDSKCSRHMTGNKSYLSDYEEIDGRSVAFRGDPKGGRIADKGKISTSKLDFEDVYFVKELKFNLFSVLQMCDRKNSVLFTNTECVVLSHDFKLFDENHVLLRVPRKDNMYSVDLKNIVPSGGLTCLFAKATLDESNLWHRRLGHINFKTLNKLVRGNIVRGLPSKIFKNNHTCVAYQKGKQHKASCKTKTISSISKSLQILHMDLFGPTFVKSLMKKMYCLVVTDDYSRFSWVFFLATKDETSEIFKTFITGIENLIDLKGIKREFSVARTPQQNGVAERKNRTLIEAARFMLADSKLLFKNNIFIFYAKAVNTACYVQNKVLVINPHNKTPYERFLGRKPALSFIRPFGCPVTILNTLDHLGKFDGKANEGFFVEYSTNSKAYRVFNSRTRIVKENLHVKFSEETPNIARNGPNWLFDIDALTISMKYKPVVAGNQTNGNPGTKENIDACQAGKKIVPDQEYIMLPLLTSVPSLSKSSEDSSNDGFKPSYEDEKMDFKHPENKDCEVPNTEELRVNQEQDANVNSTNNINTISPTVSAADIENNVVDENIVYGCIDDPCMPNLEEIIYSDDDEEVGAEADMNNLATTVPDELLQFKLQKVWTLVDLPYGKRAIDYDAVFAPVARIEAIRLFLAYALFMNFIVYQMDMKSAFLYGTIEEEVYVCQPRGFEDLEFPNKFYKVEKALYGLHQALRAWYKTLSTYLLEKRFRRGNIEKTLFIKKDKGLQVKQKDDGIFISQDKYVADIFKKFDFATVKTASTPMETNKVLLKDKEAINVDVHLYRSMIGSLMYLTASGLDIMFTVCACARFQVTPKTSHLHVVKRIFRYLKGNPQQEVINFLEEGVMDPKSITLTMKAQSALLRIKCFTQRLSTLRLDITSFQYLIAGYSEWNGTVAKDEFHVSAVRVTYYWQVYFMLLVAFNIVVKIKNVEPIKQKWVKVLVLAARHSLTAVRHKLMLPGITYYCWFWATAKAKIINRKRHIQALVDKKKVIITEKSVRSDLMEGKGFSGRITPLFQTMMVQALEDMGEDSAAPTDSHSTPIITQPSSSKPQKKKSKRKQRKDNGPTEPIPNEATNEEPISTPSCDPPQSAKTAQVKEIASLKKRVKQLEKRKNSRTSGLKSLRKEDASKQGRKIADLDADAEEVVAEKEVAEKEVSAADLVTTDGEVVTTSNATTTVDELTLAETLIEIKEAKPKVVTTSATTITTLVASTRPKAKGIVFHDQEEQASAFTPIVSSSQLPRVKDKGKEKMVKPEKPLKKKDQIALDEELALRLHAEEQAELEKEKVAQEEASRVAIIEELDSIQAMIEADEQLATRL